MDENFYQFIVLESIEETPITKLSPFLIKKNKKQLKRIVNQSIKKSYEHHHYYTNYKSEKNLK